MPSFAGARELSGLLGVGRKLLGGVGGIFTGAEIFNQGRPGSLVDKSVQNLPGIIPDPRTDVGRNLGRSFGNELRYMGGQAAQGKVPYSEPSKSAKGTRPIGTQAVLNGKPVYWGGDDYGWQLLNQTGSSATLNSLNAPGTQNQFIQDSFSGSPAGAPLTRPAGAGSFTPLDPYAAQNREYERERARVEAMVKANPDMQKQAIADERAKVRDQGMAIWAQKNPELAAKLQPGAVGYDATRGAVAGQAATQGFGYQLPQQVVLTPPPGVNALQSFPAVESIQPTETYGTEGLQTDPEMLKKFQALLNSRGK